MGCLQDFRSRYVTWGNGWFLSWNFIALAFILVPIWWTAPHGMDIDVADMQKEFPSIGFAIRNSQHQACLNSQKDTKHKATVKNVEDCLAAHMNKDDSDVKINLDDFYAKNFSVYEEGVAVKDQVSFASVWHYYTTLYEYHVNYQLYQRYRSDLCGVSDCTPGKPFNVVLKHDSLDKLKQLYPDAIRNDEVGIFVKTYNYSVYETDMLSFQMHLKQEQMAHPFMFKDSDNNYHVFKVDLRYYKLDMTSAAQDATISDHALSELLQARVNQFGNVTYLSQWEADVYKIKSADTIVFQTSAGKKKSVVFSASTTYSVPETCMLCNKKPNPSTPFMPVYTDTRRLNTDAPEYLESPDKCLKAYNDSSITGAINAVWHFVLLMFVILGFLNTSEQDANTQIITKLVLIALFLNAGLIRLWTYGSVWNCRYVDGFAWRNQLFAGLLFGWGLLVLGIEIARHMNGRRTQGYANPGSEGGEPLVEAKTGFVNQPAQAYMFRIA